MDQLNRYLEQLIATSGHELHLRPNANPYLVSSSGNRELGNVPLQGSQISMMVFPLIPADVKLDLPNRPSVEFVHPSSIGEFNFTVQKSAAGFNVTITPIAPGSPSIGTPTASSPPAADEAVKFAETPLAGESPITFDLQPIQETFAAGNSVEPETSLFSGPSEFETGAPQNTVAFTNSVPTFGDLSVEGFHPAEEYIPVLDNTTDLPAEQVVKNPVQDRRSTERHGSNSEMKDRMEALFQAMARTGASDLHLSAGTPPMVRKDGHLQKLQCDESVLTEDLVKDLLHSIMPERNKEEFAARRDTDFAYEIPGFARFRMNIFMERKGMGAVFRLVPARIPTEEQLGLPKAIMDLCDLSDGLVIVAGPAGSGRSTTLAAVLNRINSTRERHIITIEDPVEFVHENIKCLVNQREVHNHTMSFKDATRAALREDPDVIMLGEMHDPETISTAIEAAETGRLVFGALHTRTALSAIDRIIGQFHADRQPQARAMLSESLKAVVAQTLLPRKTGGSVAAFEVLVVTPDLSNLIREGKTSEIPPAMQTGHADGMVTLNYALFDLVQKGIVEPRDAYIKAVDKTGFEAMLTKCGFRI